jgi:hypothetical protein
MDSTFPFLKLPREIRDLTYELLVSTPYTLTYIDNDDYDDPYRPLFAQSTAILLVNKQTSAEARDVFYSKNEFVVVRFVGGTEQLVSRFNDPLVFPAFGQRQRIDSVDPVLNITIQTFSDRPEDADKSKIYTLLTTTDAIDNIIKSLWNYMCDGSPGPNESLDLALNFRAQNPLRRKVLHEHVLKPWDQVFGFKEISLEGDIDQNLQEHLSAYMKLGPHPDDVIRYLELYRRRAEDYQKRKLYYHAGWYWKHLHWYWVYNAWGPERYNEWSNEPRLFKYDLDDALEATHPMIVRSMLENVKAGIQLQSYNQAGYDVMRSFEWIKNHDSFASLKVNAREVQLVKARLFLCDAVVSVGFPEEGYGEIAFKHLDSAVTFFIHANNQYHMDLTNLKDKLCWAIDTYFMNLGLPHRYKQQVWLDSKNHTDKKVSREGWPTFWEWLDSTEVLRIEDETQDVP